MTRGRVSRCAGWGAHLPGGPVLGREFTVGWGLWGPQEREAAPQGPGEAGRKVLTTHVTTRGSACQLGDEPRAVTQICVPCDQAQPGGAFKEQLSIEQNSDRGTLVAAVSLRV